MGPDRVLREAEVPISTGYTLDKLVGLIKKVLHASGVMQIVVTPQALHIARYVLPTESVIPEDEEDQVVPPLDAFLSKPIETLQGTEDKRPFTKLQQACDLLRTQGLRPSLVIAPEKTSALLRFFSFSEETPPTHLIGIPVEYMLGPEYHEQLLVFGGTTYLLDDIEVGVSVDLGGE